MSLLSKLSGMFGGGGGGKFPPGTRAFESQMTCDLLENVIARRRSEGASADDIAYLEGQLADHRQVVASGDTSPGTGAVGYDPYPG